MRKFTAGLTAVLLAAAQLTFMTGCGGNKSGSSQGSTVSGSSQSEDIKETGEEDTGITETAEEVTEPETEPETKHISPVETVTAAGSTQQTINQTILRAEGSNTIQLPLADYITSGDTIERFTFIIYSDSGSNIGTFKGGCGISVSEDCPLATDDGWYQSEDFSAETQGSYGEIVWEVPAGIREYIPESGDVLFGYWWGNTESVRLENVVCTYTSTRQLPVDGTAEYQVGKTVSYSDEDNTIRVPAADIIGDSSVPQAVTFNISSSGRLGKFTGAFGYSSSVGYYQSPDTAVFTDNSSLSLTWFPPENAKQYAAADGELVLGYWWSEQQSITLDSVTVKYSSSDGVPQTISSGTDTGTDMDNNSGGFRTSAEIAAAIKVGWNLGNTLDSYDTGKTGLYTETGWGNLKTTEDMIQSVKDAGFNAIRIPVTWGEHMDGNTIQTEWLDRVQEVVDYAYSRDMFVILNMHHDDYIWFVPDEEKYAECSEKLKAIWEQISARFESYGDRLLFEGMNEPRTVGSASEWMGGTSAERAVVNRYEQDFVDTVRSSGGNNANRTLIVTTYGASAEDAAVNDVIVPDSGNIILSLHYYAPWKFSDGQSTTFGSSEKAELSAKFASIKSRLIDRGITVIIGEFGCVAAADDETRAEYYRHYISSAKASGIKCFIWDNGVTSGEGAYGILSRGSLRWNETILEGIMNGAES
ncbi:MAG: cellulase family glycosylhydrolase [Ruminococcus sp.]|nr:cellulase family glycosylhydrolase [Ruminococcus sp.]